MQAVTKERVLLVDDEPQVLVALEDILSDKFTVFKAESAERALNVIERECNIAVVITDQRMPKMTGDELLAKLGDSSDALRILLTGFADLSAVIRAVNDGRIFAYVTKPWNPADLRLTVDKAAEHFRLNKELVYERQLLHDLMENIPDGIYFKDRDLRFLRANRAFANSIGLSDPDQLVGKTLQELQAQTDRELEQAEERNIFRSGTPSLDVVRKFSHAKPERWYSETKAPIRTSQGEVIGLVGISRDVSERVQTAEALRISEQRQRNEALMLQSIVNSMGEGVVVRNRSGKYLLFNRRAEKILGFAPSDIAPSDWGSGFGVYCLDQKTPLPDRENPLLRAMAGEDVSGAELFVRNARVPGITIAVTATPLRDGQEQVVGGVAILRDVTDQRRLEQQLMQAQKMEAIGQLAGGVAHDFNNLLVVIQSYADLVMRELPEGDSKREDLSEVLAAAQRASSLTRQLLAFSRRQILQPKPLDLNQTVMNVEKMLRRVIGENIDLVATLSPLLWTVQADAGQIEQIILNLAINARDAMPEGGKLTIETCNLVLNEEQARLRASVKPGDYVVLAVTDTGIGMDAATRARIFEPFFTTKEVGKGTGLGLSMVYGIVQQSGGHIVVASELGQGTSFKVYLPRVDRSAEVPERMRSVSVAAPGRETVLLVEDDEAVRNLVARVLRQHGYTVIETATVSDARAICSDQTTRIDLLLTDVVMPEISGTKLARELTRERVQTRVLFMSGYSGSALPSREMPGEGAPYLSKPFTPRALLEKVRNALDAPN